MNNSRKGARPLTDGAPHIVLLGDSIFDNSSYTSGEPDVVTHLRGLLPTDGKATLVATDGSTTQSMSRQISRIPGDATHLIVSIGGNDALQSGNLLNVPARSTTEALLVFADRIASFEADYRSALQAVFDRSLPVTLCTIYNGRLADRQLARSARIALMMFNDVILRVAFEHHGSVIDLRLLCTETGDYANEIEPSGAGGLKIAKAIARATGILPLGDHCIVCSS